MRENRLSGSEGGGTKPIVAPYPYVSVDATSAARFAGFNSFLIVYLGLRSQSLAPP